MIDELKRFPEIPLPERLQWATRSGAEALGIDAWAGSFDIGKRPGAVLITGIDWDTLTLLPHRRQPPHPVNPSHRPYRAPNRPIGTNAAKKLSIYTHSK